jgi:hypothetical protein
MVVINKGQINKNTKKSKWENPYSSYPFIPENRAVLRMMANREESLTFGSKP